MKLTKKEFKKYYVELWEDMSFDEVFDTFQEIQARYINLTTKQ